MKSRFLALLLSSGAAAADMPGCGFESEFDLRLEPAALVFHHDAAVIELLDGRLSVDGRTVAGAESERQDLRRYEDGVRDLVPEIRALATEAVGLAGSAVVEVAASLQASPAVGRRVGQIVDRLKARIADTDDTAEWSDGQLDKEAEALIAELAPLIAGEAAASAMRIAMSGDLAAAEALTRRAAGLETEIGSRIAQRLSPIERQVRQLCPRLRELDMLESRLDLRLPDGRRFDLLQPTP